MPASTISDCFALLLAIEVGLAMGSGVAIAANAWGILVVLILAQIPTLASILRAGQVAFGWSASTWRQECIDLSFGGALVGSFSCLLPVFYSLPPKVQAPYGGIVAFSMFLVLWSGGRHGPTAVYGIFFGIGAVQTTMNKDAPKFSPLVFGALAAMSGTALFAQQARGQNITMALGFVVATSATTGGYLHTSVLSRAVVYALVMIVSGYNLLLFRRRRRYFAAGLQEIKWIRLSYLRALSKNGTCIQRQQLLPPDAFGDPATAAHLIVMSHRWMNRYTCDIPTLDCPEGLRLKTMLTKLDAYFSPAGFGVGDTFKERWRRCWASITGGTDVLVFFDFMSLPQEGMSDVGEKILRSPEEERVFETCLPNMGSLYSMFPVMVCEEVCADVSPYDSSGWCFSERSIATLGGQLHKYSSFFSMQYTNLDEFNINFDAELQEKMFVIETDREVVRNIVADYLRKRRLVDAISAVNIAEMCSVLKEVQACRLQDMLDQPVDKLFNTMLHLAVMKRFEAGARVLIEHGANPHLRNIRGDVPAQVFMWPRLSAAAYVCHVKPHTLQKNSQADDAQVVEHEDSASGVEEAPRLTVFSL